MSVLETSCCGLYEFCNLHRYQSTKEAVLDMIEELKDEKDYIQEFPPVILFTDARDKYGNTKPTTRGEKLVKYITGNELGEIVKTPYRLNPNSGNRIQCYLWTLNKKNLEAWYIKNNKI